MIDITPDKKSILALKKTLDSANMKTMWETLDP